MNRKGFTLMELLLVVAVLAIVAAAAAPTFFGGAQEAMEEAKKSTFLSAYQNTLSGANLMVSIAASQGKTPSGDADIDLTAADPLGTGKTLNDYAPEAARTFNLDDTYKGALKATYVASKKGVYVYYNGNPVELEPNKTYTFTDLKNKLAGSSTSGTNP